MLAIDIARYRELRRLNSCPAPSTTPAIATSTISRRVVNRGSGTGASRATRVDRLSGLPAGHKRGVATRAFLRRKFYEARSNAPREANRILEWIRQLYVGAGHRGSLVRFRG